MLNLIDYYLINKNILDLSAIDILKFKTIGQPPFRMKIQKCKYVVDASALFPD